MFDTVELGLIRNTMAFVANSDEATAIVRKIDAMQANWIRLTLPLPPQQLHPNGRAHWRAKASAKSAYRKLAGEAAAIQMMQSGKGKPRWAHAMIQLEYWRVRKQTRSDPDNLISWAKTTIDSLQDAGVLADDRQLTYQPPLERLGTKEAKLCLYLAAT